MRIRIVAAGSRQPKWLDQGVEEYVRRLPREFKLEFLEIPLGNRSANSNIQRAQEEESKRMLATIRDTDTVVTLNVTGKPLSTEALAKRLSAWIRAGRNLVFLIGGPDGLHPKCQARSDFDWSLSPLTFPHGLVRILLVEQLYRSWTVLNHHPYHRA